MDVFRSSGCELHERGGDFRPSGREFLLRRLRICVQYKLAAMLLQHIDALRRIEGPAHPTVAIARLARHLAALEHVPRPRQRVRLRERRPIIRRRRRQARNPALCDRRAT